MIVEKEIPLREEQIRAINTSYFTLEGVQVLRDMITDWIAENGIKGTGVR